jgi:hypothetical protein
MILRCGLINFVDLLVQSGGIANSASEVFLKYLFLDQK